MTRRTICWIRREVDTIENAPGMRIFRCHRETHIETDVAREPRHTSSVIPDVAREPGHTTPIIPDVAREPGHTTPVLSDAAREPGHTNVAETLV